MKDEWRGERDVREEGEKGRGREIKEVGGGG